MDIDCNSSSYRFHLKTVEDANVNDDTSLICPAMTLIDLAKQNGKMDELVQEITAHKPKDPLSEKSKDALLFLTAIANDDDASAMEAMASIYTTMDQLDKTNPEPARASEMIVAWVAAARPQLQIAARDIAKKLVETMPSRASSVHQRRVKGLRGRIKNLRLTHS